MIKIDHLCAGYGEQEVLHDISMTFQKGKLTILVGPNGCGKSTLLKNIIRLNNPTSGQIQVDGESIDTLDASVIAKKIAYLPQGKQVPDITVSRMVLHGRFAYLKYPRRYRKEDYEMASKAMRWVGIEDLSNKNVSQLSGGMQQKVYIAMALAQDTPVILLDEPTTYLDIVHQMKLMDLAKSLTNEGKTVVMVLHDLAQAFRYGDHIVVMSEGKIKAEGSPEDIYASDVINKTFQIRLNRVYTDAGWQYFYEER